VLALGKRGYQPVVEGTNGFVCLVERSWNKPFEDAEFWNPRVRAPTCYNPASARTVLPVYLQRTDWVMSELSPARMWERAKAQVGKSVFPMPAAGSMAYMMSRQGHLADDVGPAGPHLMFFLPRVAEAAWGANLPESPIAATQGDPEAVTTFYVSTRKWSDGSAVGK
jgi:hypothetical protein